MQPDYYDEVAITPAFIPACASWVVMLALNMIRHAHAHQHQGVRGHRPMEFLQFRLGQ
jgi:hypothetical protein